MKLFICPNTNHSEQIDKARAVVAALEGQVCSKCLMNGEVSRLLYGDSSHEGDASDCEIVVSVGGDGAVLRAFSIAFDNNIPLAGINAGRLGRLCAFSVDEIVENPQLMTKLKSTERSVLEVEYCGKKYRALNDVVIAKEYFGATVSLKVDIDSDVIETWRGDGVIVSTPTGSSGYNFSAGGPVIDCMSDNFVVTPICPHEGRRSSTEFNENSILSVSIPYLQENAAGIYVDGNRIGILKDKAVIRKCQGTLTLLTR